MAGPEPAMMADRKPMILFVVGASRSGTTMLNRILGRHSAIKALNELHYFGEVWNPNQGVTTWNDRQARKAVAMLLTRIRRGIWGGPPTENEITDAAFLLSSTNLKEWNPVSVFDAVLAKQARHKETIFITDQTPRNVFYARTLLELFPEARVVQIVRDPRAVLYSQRNRWRRRRLGANNMPSEEVFRLLANYHPATMAQLWKQATQEGMALNGHSRFKLVRFEDLVRSPERQIASICGFLGLQFEKQMLDVPQVGSSHKRHDPQRRGVSADIMGAWRGRLALGDIVLCEWMTGKLMRKLDYERCSRALWYPAVLSPLLRLPLHVFGVALSNPRRALIQARALIGGWKTP